MVESSVAARWSGMGSAVVRGFGRARAGVCQAAAQPASSRPVAGPKPGPGRRGGRLDILAALLLGAALAAPAWAQDIVHPRVLMDTQITVGGYRVTNDASAAGIVDNWGYAAGQIKVRDATGDVVQTVHDGSLDDTGFAYGGVEYTVSQLTITSNTTAFYEEFRIEIEDAQGTALPDTAAVGIELQGSPTGETVLFDWRRRAVAAVDDEVETLLAAWRDASGAVLPVRILNLDASDVWSADLHYGTKTSLTVGYGAPATGTLTATGFALDGVEYTVDRLTVVSTTETEAVVRFATTPDLPATARLRLAVPRVRYFANPGLNRYLALEPASRVSGGTDVDYEWPWPGVSGPGTLAGDTNTFYLTRGPGRTGDVSGFWEATLTPNERVTGADASILVGYRRAGVTIPDFTHEAAGAGTLAPDTMSLGGVEYTVDALAVVAVSGSGWNVALRTDPLLPRGQDLWLELGHVDGSTAVFAIDTATVEAPGYLWRDAYAGEDRHGWGTDGSDDGTDIDSVTVRLATGAPTITGTAQVGQTLTAVTTGITDADGLISATYTYQWIQVNGTAADIAGENSSTYTLVGADLGKAIKVKVSFTDDASNAETRTSAATATVTAAATTTTQTLVSNTGQGNGGNRPVAATQYAQPFDTGTNSAGYNLAGIALDFERAPSGSGTLTVTVRETSSGGPSGTALYTLTNPIFSDGSNEFLAPPNAELNANTQYWVMVSYSANSGGPLWYRTLLSYGVDTGAAAGWAIDTTYSFKGRSETAWTASTNRAFQIDVKGSAKTGTVTNTAPTVATAILDQTATAGTVFIFNVPEDTFTDADSDTLTYSATQSDGSALPAWLSFDAAVPGFSGLPQAADVETVSVKLTASDGNGGSVSDTFDIVVSADTTVNCAGMCLVSNIGQTPENVQGFTNTDYAQSFTTGTNATGYTLTSIELKLSSSSGVATTPTVKLFRVSANGTEVATLIGATMLDENITKDYAFTPSSTVNLLTSTTYWVVAEGVSGVSWTNTAATSEDATPAAGWGIGDLYETRSASSTGGFTTTSTTALQIRVNGTLGSTTVTNNPPTVANAIQDQTATVGTALSFAFPATTFNDADSDTLTYTATQSDDSALPLVAELRRRHAHVLGHADGLGRGDGLGEGDGERRQWRLGQRHLRHRGLGGRQQRPDVCDRHDVPELHRDGGRQ